MALGIGTYGLVTSAARQREADNLVVNGSLPSGSEAKQEALEKEASKYKAIGIAGIATGVVATGAAIGCYLYSNTEPESGKVKVGIVPNGVVLAGEF